MSLRTDKIHCLRPETRQNSFAIKVLPYDWVAASVPDGNNGFLSALNTKNDGRTWSLAGGW